MCRDREGVTIRVVGDGVLDPIRALGKNDLLGVGGSRSTGVGAKGTEGGRDLGSRKTDVVSIVFSVVNGVVCADGTRGDTSSGATEGVVSRKICGFE